MATHFGKVGGLRPSRTAFDLTHTYKTDLDMGWIVPVLCEKAIAGDRWIIGNELTVRMQPMVTPIYHPIDASIHYYFVPFRLLDEKWQDFFTGGEDGEDNTEMLKYGDLRNPEGGIIEDHYLIYCNAGTLFNRFGFGLSNNMMGNPHRLSVLNVPRSSRPQDYPRRAYYFIYNEYYRDQNYQKPYAFKEEHYNWSMGEPTVKEKYREVGDENVKVSIGGGTGFNSGILYRNWSKNDYFASILPFAQRGTAPALPIGDDIRAIFDFPVMSYDTNLNTATNNVSISAPGFGSVRIAGSVGVPDLNLEGALSAGNKITGTTLFNINDLRTAIQIQKWLERNARAGVRYTEFLRAHFGVAPRDDRLQRPEYIGGSKQPIIISEVLQTSQTDQNGSPQGTMVGHGLSADRTRCCNYEVKEPGVIMGLLSIMPKAVYQNGISRQWLGETKFDEYFREFANLGEQAVLSRELFCDSDASLNLREEGFQARYDEYRYIPSRVTGLMALGANQGGFNFWHLSRIFNQRPTINESFLAMHGDNATYKRIFAVPSRTGFLVNVVNIIKAVRPLPFIGEPGMMDHF